MGRLPKKRDILERARNISTKRAAIHGLPTITPTEAELKESGAYHEARIDLMRREETGAFAQQERYMREMAGEMGLKLVSTKDFQKYEKGVTKEWRFLQKVKKAEFEREKLRTSWLETLKREKQLKRKYARQLPKVQAFDVFRAKYPGRVVKVNGYKIVLPAIPKPKPIRHPPRKLARVSLRKPLDVGVAIRGAPKPKKHRKPSRIFDTIEAKPKPKKRKKRHTNRTGLTMRKLRKVKGVKVFSFPDDVWKVRKR